MKGTYRTDPSTEAQATAVELGDGRHFLVVRFKLRDWTTIVLEHEVSPECWISRRQIDGNVDPVLAVTGHLLRPSPADPVSQMRRDLAIARRSNWALQDELLKAKAELAAIRRDAKEKRGNRGRRNP